MLGFFSFRLFRAEEGPPDEGTSEEEQGTSSPPRAKISKKDELEALLSGSDKGPKKDFVSDSTLLGCFKKEFSVLESTGERPSCSEKVYQALLTLPPSSTEAERTFSTAGFFVTKLRSKLGDNVIDTLCFLRSYLMQVDK